MDSNDNIQWEPFFKMKKNISNLNLYKQILNCFSYCK